MEAKYRVIYQWGIYGSAKIKLFDSIFSAVRFIERNRKIAADFSANIARI